MIALNAEVDQWEQGNRSAEAISRAWSEKLHAQNVARLILSAVDQKSNFSNKTLVN
jgi:hypothetical protein